MKYFDTLYFRSFDFKVKKFNELSRFQVVYFDCIFTT